MDQDPLVATHECDIPEAPGLVSGAPGLARDTLVPGDGDIDDIVEKHRGKPGDILAILQELQAKYLHIPRTALVRVAELTGRSQIDVFGTATFYNAFSLKPRGRHLVSVCQGTACHVRGAPVVAAEVGRQLGVGPGETTTSREFTFETVNCLGACALGPVVVVDGHYSPNVSKDRVSGILERAVNGEDREEGGDPRVFPLRVACPNCNHGLLDPVNLLDGYPSIWVTASFGDLHGWVRLSSLYGRYTVESKHEIPYDTVVHFFCPHCHGELIGASRCVECDAPMVPMILAGGGTLQICTRRGCRSHILNLGATPID